MATANGSEKPAVESFFAMEIVMDDGRPANVAAVQLLDNGEARKLVAGLPAPSPVVLGAVLDHIDEHFARFIALSPLCFLSSSDENGVQEVSPRGDPAGSFKVLDRKHFAIADRPGNNRIDTLKNLLVNPKMGFIFIIPGIDHTLRISGEGRLSLDSGLLESMSIADRMAPRVAIVVEVDKAHLHCAKAFRRSRVWEADSHVPSSDVPSFTKTIADQMKMAAEREAEFAARIARNNIEGLWENKS